MDSPASLADYARKVLGECAAIPDERLITRQYVLPFVDLQARFSDPGLATHCDRALAVTDDAWGRGYSAEITVVDADKAGIARPAPLQKQLNFSSDLDRMLADKNLRASYWPDGPYWQFFDAAAARGAGLMPRAGGYPVWEASSPLRLFLHWLYAGLGLRIGHAGTLGIDGRGVLLAGRSGAGKSATTLAGVLEGLDSVGDDYIVLDKRSAPTAYPLFRWMKQDEMGLERLGLGNLLQRPGDKNWQDKYEFDFDALGRGRRAAKIEIGAILVPRITGQSRTTIAPLANRDAMLALAPSGIFQLQGDQQSGFAFFSGVVRQLPCFRLHLGTDSSEIGRTIAEFIESRA